MEALGDLNPRMQVSVLSEMEIERGQMSRVKDVAANDTHGRESSVLLYCQGSVSKGDPGMSAFSLW
jgi:hypothetical protein